MPSADGIPRRRALLDGITWKVVLLMALLSLLYALRRNSYGSFFRRPIADLPLMIGVPFLSGFVVAMVMALFIVATYNRTPERAVVRYPLLGLAILASSAIGMAFVIAIETGSVMDCRVNSMKVYPQCTDYVHLEWTITRYWPDYVIWGTLLTVVFGYFRNAAESEAAARQAEIDRGLLDQQMQEARLQVLQAQIEPHFLFNTLATVRRLYQTDRLAARGMLGNLMRYLAVALPQMRANESTLGRETALAQAYLGIEKVRMDARLGFAIDVPERLHDAKLPPMMLLTLVENAIKHGLNPLPEGGFMRVSADVDAGRLRLLVSDTGRGFTKSAGGGTGLANIRARLAAMYGPAAQLDLTLNRPRGVTATLVLPYSG
jgi:LytS/YehU family sensor histidine kinase